MFVSQYESNGYVAEGGDMASSTISEAQNGQEPAHLAEADRDTVTEPKGRFGKFEVESRFAAPLPKHKRRPAVGNMLPPQYHMVAGELYQECQCM